MPETNQAKKTASDVLADLRPYLATLAHDEKLRRRLVAAVAGRVVTHRRSTTQALWGQIVEVVSELRQVDDRVRRKRRSRTVRNSMLVLVGASVLWVALPKLRLWAAREGHDVAREDGDEGSADKNPAIVQYIDVDVPISTAYNQWTQFDEFPRFMEGVDEVKQLDDTLLHWAVTVAGRKTEWDAKITSKSPIGASRGNRSTADTCVESSPSSQLTAELRGHGSGWPCRMRSTGRPRGPAPRSDSTIRRTR